MNKEIINGKAYISTTYKGSEYTLTELCGEWYVSTKRIALGRSNTGSGKYYKTLNEISEKCKAFSDVSKLIEMFYGVAI